MLSFSSEQQDLIYVSESIVSAAVAVWGVAWREAGVEVRITFAVQAVLEVQASAASLGGGDVRSLEGSPAGHRSAFTDVAGLLKE